MATPFTTTLDRLIACFQAAFEHSAVVRREERPSMALIEMSGDYGAYQVRLKEIRRADGVRRYAYYVLDRSAVVVGFDNASDPRALRLKYGKNYVHHRLELIPHRHARNKGAIDLSDEMDGESFVSWVKENLPRTQ